MLTKRGQDRDRRAALMLAAAITAAILTAAGCSRGQVKAAGTYQESVPTVGVAPVAVQPIARQLTVSSELVPFQEIDVYAKESGFVRDLRVDYGSRVKQGDLMAVLEIPELETQLARDAASIKQAADQITLAQNEVKRVEAQRDVAHLQYTRLKSVADSRPGLVAQQEVDDAQGKALAAEAQVEASKSAQLARQNQLDEAKAKEQTDKVLFQYARITAPFSGVVTQRYANFGTLMQAGTSSSTQAMPLVRLSEDDRFRLVIPVAESYVRYIRIGDPVDVRVPSLGKSFSGKVTRFSVDVTQDTRTMHTEVDIPNPQHVLMPGLYADAILTLEQKQKALVVPVQAVTLTGNNQGTVLIVDMNNRVQLRPVAVGLETPNHDEILSGLNEGDRVVVSDRSGLKPGTVVKAQEATSLLQYEGSTDSQ
jgi:RND family efflux transporter MFP subunit